MDLTTNYCGLKLKHPFMPGASPMADDLDVARRLEDAGAAAVVMHSLFEEQITGERHASIYHMELYANAHAEAHSYFPDLDDYKFGKHEYLDHIRKLKKCLAIPVIASLNGTSPGGWTDWARLMEESGADALELNVYHVSTDPQETCWQLEDRIVETAQAVRKAVKIPMAVKLSPFFGALPHLVARLDQAGVDGVVLFNRFYQPDIDIINLETKPTLKLSDPSELLLRLRWLAILARQAQASLACSGGVHTAEDGIKAIMAGASAVQVVSAILRNGIAHFAKMVRDYEKWLIEHEYRSTRQMLGSMSQTHCPDPQAFERANYMRTLHSWRKNGGVVV
jgi:dihydroorotate dehydrogenase (fumarate)